MPTRSTGRSHLNRPGARTRWRWGRWFAPRAPGWITSIRISIRFRRPTNRISDRRAYRAGAHLKRIRDNAKRCSIGYQLVEQLQLFCRQLGRYVGDAGNVRAGPVEVGDKNPADAFVRGSQHRRRMSLSQCTNYRWRTAAKGHGLPDGRPAPCTYSTVLSGRKDTMSAGRLLRT